MRMARTLRSLGIAVVAILLLTAISVFVSGTVTRLPGERSTPAGLQRNQALHVVMRDGTRIAVDVWLPEALAAGERVPVILQMTRYGRARQVGFLQRAAIGLNLVEAEDPAEQSVAVFNRAGFAVVKVDARGTGASFGSRRTEFTPEEIKDYGEIVEWITRQQWAAPRVGSVGVSYGSNTAELLLANRHPAVRAAALLYGDFDPQYGLVQPGGASMAYLDSWGSFVRSLDLGETCILAGASGIKCWLLEAWSSGVKPVDGDDGTLLEAAIVEHRRSALVAEKFRSVEFRDDPVTEDGMLLAQAAPFGNRAAIEASGVPLLVVTGWLDAATTDGALSRYLTFSNPQRVVIGALSHGGRFDTDPLAPADRDPEPSRVAQSKMLVDFFRRHLGDQTDVAERGIRYFVQGSREWRESQVWPPAGTRYRELFLAPEGRLLDRIDFEPQVLQWTGRMQASSGEQTRWHTNAGGADVRYADRKATTGDRLTFSLAPGDQPLRIVGTPVVNLRVSASVPDLVFHVYLEAELPDGRTVYLTEGVLRARHHRLAAASELPYVPLAVGRGYRRQDESLLTSGTFHDIVIPLFATAAELPIGSRLQVSIATADIAMFAPMPTDGEAPVLDVQLGGLAPTKLTLPLH